MKQELTLPGEKKVTIFSDRPTILIGPNGVGKTRFSVELTKRNETDRISANRYIALGDLPRQHERDLKTNEMSALQQQNQAYWDMHNEYTYLMARIVENDKAVGQEFRTLALSNMAIPDRLKKTNKEKIIDAWESLFPGRFLNIDYTPTARVGQDGDPYSTARMSEGERTALYLITRIVGSTAPIVIIDEPEIHLHPILARDTWNKIQSLRSDACFIYITHDIPFALSRRNPKFLVVRSPTSFDEIDGSNLPEESIALILGAASFSISASRLIFCEGKQGGAEHRFFTAWYKCSSTAVIPVGGCDNVKQCVAVFNADHATKNVTALGHIDRDDWSDATLERLDTVKPLPVNEIEGITCHPPIFKALAKFYSIPDSEQLFAKFLAVVANAVKGTILNKHALNRAKLLLEHKQQELRNAVVPNADANVIKSSFAAAMPTSQDAENIFTNEFSTLQNALNTPDVLKKFPSKSYYASIATHLRVQPDKALDDVCSALNAESDTLARNEKLQVLRDDLVEGLNDFMFSRTA